MNGPVAFERKKRALDKLFQTLSSRTVVVEGKKDEEALRELGVNGSVTLAQGKSAVVVERVLRSCGGRNKGVVLLFDWDAAGEEKARLFEALFRAEGASAALDPSPRREFRHLLGCRFVEESPARLSRILEEGEVKWERRTLTRSST